MIRIISRYIRAQRDRYRLARYDEFTIAEHFRAQGAQVGENCRIYIRRLGTEPWLVRIGNHVTITAEVALVTHDGGTWLFTEEHPTLQRFGPIDIRDNCFIGLRATILPGVRIGPNSLVGAAAVVTRDVPPDTVVAGAPARVICSTDEYKAKLLAEWQRQRPPGYMSDLQEGVHYPSAVIQSAKRRDFQLLRDHLTRLYCGDGSAA